MQEPDDQFTGVISGFQTVILLNSERLHIKIESPSKENLFQALIQYKIEDTLSKQVKKTFKNFTLLFQYINEFSQDPERIRIDLNKSQMKIIKNDGPRRLKSAPILIIPLEKKYLFENKKKTCMQLQVQKVLKQNQILEFKFSHVKRQRAKLINKYEEIKKWMKDYCHQNQIKWIQKDQLTTKNESKQNFQFLSRKHQDFQLQEVLEKNQMSQIQEKESLFFESEPIHEQNYHKKSQNFKQQFKDSSYNQKFDEILQNSFSYDPFSYI